MSSAPSLPFATLHDRGVIARHRPHLPYPEDFPAVSLNEGSTPLIHSPRLSRLAGRGRRVYLKYEGLNPTGSFKDRGMTTAISHALSTGAEAVICASTGNTSAAAAAYAARAGLACIVVLPAGKIALGKLAQAIVYGAKTVAIEGNFDDALRLVRDIGQTGRAAIVNSINPHRLQGQKTAAFEIIEELGDAPEMHILPVGNAGNISAYWMGYTQFYAIGKSSRRPRMTGFQAAGSAPIFRGHPVDHPETVATAIRIGHPASWDLATAALSESNGAIDIVTDDEILAAQAWLAANEGIFVEPASAASVAGLMKCADCARQCPVCPLRNLSDEAEIVLTVTGHGLKDIEAALRKAPEIISVPATTEAVLRVLE